MARPSGQVETGTAAAVGCCGGFGGPFDHDLLHDMADSRLPEEAEHIRAQPTEVVVRRDRAGQTNAGHGEVMDFNPPERRVGGEDRSNQTPVLRVTPLGVAVERAKLSVFAAGVEADGDPDQQPASQECKAHRYLPRRRTKLFGSRGR